MARNAPSVLNLSLNLSATVDLRKRGEISVGDALAYIRDTAPQNVDRDSVESLVNYAICYCGSRKLALADNAKREASGALPAKPYAPAHPSLAPVVEAFRAAVAPVFPKLEPATPKAPTVRKAREPKAPSLEAQIAALRAENAALAAGKAPAKRDPTGLRPVNTALQGVAEEPTRKAPSAKQVAAREAFAARAKANAKVPKAPPASPLAAGLAKLSPEERAAVKAILGF